MIKLTISNLIFVYTLCSVIMILGVWVVSNYKDSKRVSPKDIDYIWKCSICFNAYVDSKQEDISICPLCGSYNKREVKT
jgi:rRNA maturation endonuclease Nob1